jgi:hypothetical protein
MKIRPVLTRNAQQVWPMVAKHIVSGLNFSQGDYQAEHAKVYLASGQWVLLIACDENDKIAGAATIEFISRPNDRVAFFTSVGGKFLTTPEVFDQVRDILKTYGATKIEGAARESAARLWQSKFGFSEKYKIVEVSL